MSYNNLLQNVNLSPHERTVYLALLEHGPQSAQDLASAAKIKRTHIYYVLKNLIACNLIEETKIKNKKAYRLTHPEQLERYIERQQATFSQVLQQVQTALPGLISEYNLHHNKPGVYFFEGKEGIIKVYEELLEDRLPIDSIEDSGTMLDYFPEYVPKYISKRIRYKLPNRAIAPSTNTLNEPDPKALRDAHFIDAKKFPFSMDIKMNSRRVMMTTFKSNAAIGVVIVDPEITKNFHLLFEFLWSVTMPVMPTGKKLQRRKTK